MFEGAPKGIKLLTTVLSLSDGIVTLYIGTDKREFTIHESLLRSSAPYFEAALKKEWKEGHMREIPMSDDDSDAVELFLQWLYSGRIWTDPCANMSGPDDDKQATSQEMWKLIKVYCFGEKIQDSCFKDVVLDCIIDWTRVNTDKERRHYPEAEHAAYVWDTTPENSRLRRLILDLYTYGIDEVHIRDVSHTGLLKDLAVSLRKGCVSSSWPYSRDPFDSALSKAENTCAYHEHGDDNPCYKQKRKRKR